MNFWDLKQNARLHVFFFLIWKSVEIAETTSLLNCYIIIARVKKNCKNKNEGMRHYYHYYIIAVCRLGQNMDGL